MMLHSHSETYEPSSVTVWNDKTAFPHIEELGNIPLPRSASIYSTFMDAVLPNLSH
jgi:hypothetical protein